MMATVRLSQSSSSSDDIIEVPAKRFSMVGNLEGGGEKKLHDTRNSKLPSISSSGKAVQISNPRSVADPGVEATEQASTDKEKVEDHPGGMGLLLRAFSRRKTSSTRGSDGNLIRSPLRGSKVAEDSGTVARRETGMSALQCVGIAPSSTPTIKENPNGTETRQDEAGTGPEEEKKAKKPRGPSSPTNAVAMRSVNSIHKQGKPEEAKGRKRSSSRAQRPSLGLGDNAKSTRTTEMRRSSSPDSAGEQERGRSRSRSRDRRGKQHRSTSQKARSEAKKMSLLVQKKETQHLLRAQDADTIQRKGEKSPRDVEGNDQSSGSDEDSDIQEVEDQRGADLFPERGEEPVDWTRYGRVIAAFDWREIKPRLPAPCSDDEKEGVNEAREAQNPGTPAESQMIPREQKEGAVAGPRTVEEWAEQAIALVRRKMLQPAAVHPGFVGEAEDSCSKCVECGGGEDKTTLLCDFCDNACHVRCLPKNAPPLARLAGKDWECASCRKAQEEMGSAVLVGATWRGEKAPWRVALQKAEEGRVRRRDSPDSVLLAGEKEREAGPRRWMRGKWSAAGTIRIGDMFQAELPECRGEGEVPTLPSREELGSSRGTPFGCEMRVPEEELEKERIEEEQNCIKRLSKVHPNKLFEDRGGEKWVQCRAVVMFEGEIRPNGKRSKKNVECGKWRRIPLDVKVDLSKFDCSWAIPHDPHYADCAVPQVFDNREIYRRRTRLKKR